MSARTDFAEHGRLAEYARAAVATSLASATSRRREQALRDEVMRHSDVFLEVEESEEGEEAVGRPDAGGSELSAIPAPMRREAPVTRAV